MTDDIRPGKRDAALMAVAALAWGSSYLFIDVADEALAPSVVALARIVCGAMLLACVPAARRRLPRSALPGAVALGVTWMALPFVLFAQAERTIDSSLAGMLNGAAPFTTALVAAVAMRRPPGRRHAGGLLIGALGLVLLAVPAASGGHAQAAGVALVLAAVVSYGVAFNLAARLQPRHGALPVVLHAQVAAGLLLLPFTAATTSGTEITLPALAAVGALGALGTGVAFVAFATLAGRIGASRASMTTYIVPAVALALGVAFRHEHAGAAAIAGGVLVTAGADVSARDGARRVRRRRSPAAVPVADSA